MRIVDWETAEDFETEERWSRPKRERIYRKANRHCEGKRAAKRYREEEAVTELELEAA